MNEQENHNTTDWRNSRLDEVPREAGAADEAAEPEAEDFVPRRELPRDTRLDMEVIRVERAEDEEFGSVDDVEDEERNGSDGGEDQPAEGEQPKRRQRFKLIREFMLGTILNNSLVRENYRYVIIFACLLFFSIVMLFTSLGTYLRYVKLEDEVRLLRERSIRMNEERYEESSHTAIVNKLRERGINLADPQEPHEKLD